MDLPIIIIIILLVSSVSAFLIAKKLMDAMADKGKKQATLIGVLAFVACFMIMLFIFAAIIISNLNFGR